MFVRLLRLSLAESLGPLPLPPLTSIEAISLDSPAPLLVACRRRSSSTSTNQRTGAKKTSHIKPVILKSESLNKVLNQTNTFHPDTARSVYQSGDPTELGVSPKLSLDQSAIKKAVLQSATVKSDKETAVESVSLSQPPTLSTSSVPCSSLPASPLTPAPNPTGGTEFYRRQLPRTCVSFCSDEGKVIFGEALRSGHMDSYFQLASQFMTQDEPAFCGLSTLVMVLNALEVDPNRVWKAPWRWYNEGMLDCCVPLSVVRTLGLTLDQFACLAACNTLSVLVQRTDDTSLVEEFRALVRSVTRRTDCVVVTSYSRQALEQTGDGHFSCVGGYHPDKDLVLMMDTARFKYPPHWVPLPLLYKAMQRIDTDTGLPRGYLLLSKSRMPTALLFHLSPSISPIKVIRTSPPSSPLPSSHTSLSSSSVNNFIQAWESWLLEKTSEHSSDDLAFIPAAVRHLTSLLGLLDEGTTLLTTQLDDSQARNNLTEYSAQLEQLIKSLELSSLYEIVRSTLSEMEGHEKLLMRAGVLRTGPSGLGREVLGENKESSELHGLNSPDIATARQKLDHRVSNSRPSIPVSKSGAVDFRVSEVAEGLNAAHYITMLLLSWPYHQCTGSKRSAALRGSVTTCLVTSGNDLLDRETSRLRQQLTSILNYRKTTK